jgi:hypothetical protein
MFEKKILPCLATIITIGVSAAITLTLPLNVNAASTNQKKSILPIGLVLANQSLSAADVNSIKKEIAGIIKATNDKDQKKFIEHYSEKFQGVDGDSSTYNDLAKNAGLGLGLIKAFGMKIKAQNITVVKTGTNKALAELTYKVDLDKKSPLLDSPEKEKLTKNPYGMSLTFEKINGRWLVLSSKNTNIAGSTSIATGNSKIEAPIAKIDQQFFNDFFKHHLDTLNRKNLNEYLATLDAKSPQYNKTKAETAQLFKEYTLKYSVQSVKVISLSKDRREAVVEMSATVKKVSGGGFKDSKITTTSVLKKNNGKWQIFDTSIDSLTDLVAKK